MESFALVSTYRAVFFYCSAKRFTELRIGVHFGRLHVRVILGVQLMQVVQLGFIEPLQHHAMLGLGRLLRRRRATATV